MIKQTKRATGFTLIELMVTLAVLAILVGLAAPSFIDLIRANRLATQTSLFATALNLARSEAIKRNKMVTVCKRNTAGTSCDTTAAWRDGWVVFVDENRNGSLDGGDEVLRTFDPLATGFALGGTAINWYGYLPTGFGTHATPIAVQNFRLCASDALSANDVRRSRTIQIAITGRINLSEGASACP